jgi:hypothetical protein
MNTARPMDGAVTPANIPCYRPVLNPPSKETIRVVWFSDLKGTRREVCKDEMSPVTTVEQRL